MEVQITARTFKPRYGEDVQLIEPAARTGRNAMAIWQDLVDQHGFTAGYASVKRFVNKLRGTQSPEERVVIETPPGREAQVDYGDGPMVRHPETGKYRRTRLFLMTLGFSRKSVRLLVWKSSSSTWAELHEQAFRRLGGVTETVVLDNLKEGVLAPDVYDPALNPLYRDVLKHYGVTALPCRVRDPGRECGGRRRPARLGFVAPIFYDGRLKQNEWLSSACGAESVEERTKAEDERHVAHP